MCRAQERKCTHAFEIRHVVAAGDTGMEGW